MARQARTSWPTQPGSVFFDDAAPTATLSKAIVANTVRKLGPSLYSADLTSAPASLVARNRWGIVAHLVPDAIIADRSAARDGVLVEGRLFVLSSSRSLPIVLPGLTIDPRRGPPALVDDPAWASGLRITSDARTLVDNLARSRSSAARPARTLQVAELEDWLTHKVALRPDGWLATLGDRAVALAEELGVPERIGQVKALVSRVAGSHPLRPAGGRLLAARRVGLAWDPDRVERFDQLARFLSAIPHGLEVPARLEAPAGDDGPTLPFFEAYLSNFIEGTKFTIEEAERIIASGRPPADRPADGLDLLGTYRLVSDPCERSRKAATAEEFLDRLRQHHAVILAGRPENKPGRWKSQRNQVGSYVFVDWRLVEGTLLEGFRRRDDLPPGFPRAAFQHFIVTEVHPFEDGNGRVSRLELCAELSADGQSRLLIPVVWRNEYLTAMRVLSRDGRYDVYVKTLAWAWRWTAAMPWAKHTAVNGRLESTNALVDSTEAGHRGIRLELP